MAIRDADIEHLRAAVDIVALIGRRVVLRKKGSRYSGLCPFHHERTPSFSVSPSQGLYHCFGCGASGDAFTWLRETEQLEFQQAVESIAEMQGYRLTYTSGGERAASDTRRALLDIVGRAVRFFHDRLLSAPDARAARRYLRSRGYDGDVVRAWQLGYAPPSTTALCDALDADPELLRTAGLAYANPDGPSDVFRDRIIFPILDPSGRPVSVAGRVLPRDGSVGLGGPGGAAPSGPKYRNTAQTPVYDKSRVLFGLDKARRAAREAGRIVVCEGYTDVIGCALSGVGEAVATCGTALTESHAQLLARHTRRVVLAFDADSAGRTAAERVHQWERAHGLDIAVAALPDGSDPGDLARRNPAALRAALDDAEPLFAFRARRILQRSDLDTPMGRDRAARQVADVLAVYPADVLVEADYEPLAALIPMTAADLAERTAVVRAEADQAPHRVRGRNAEAPPPDEPPPDEPPPDAYGDPPDELFVDEQLAHYAYDGQAAPGMFGASREPGAWSAGRRRPGRPGRPGRVPAPILLERSRHETSAIDRELLRVAAAQVGDTSSLIVAELFEHETSVAVFAHVSSGNDWRERAPADASPQTEMLLADLESVTPDDLSSDEAIDIIARAMSHWVGEQLDAALQAAATDDRDERAVLGERVRWLRERRDELRHSGTWTVAAQEIAADMRSGAAPA